MRLLINLMILAGSGLMVYNIIRYGFFVKNSIELEPNGKKLKLIVPLLLLIFFLFGYVGVGISGIADLLIASILLGGSIFVFLLLLIMFSIIKHVRETDKILSNRYDEKQAELRALTADSLAVFRVDLTADEIEEKGGDGLYESDLENVTWTGLLEARRKYVLGGVGGEAGELFTRESLIRLYEEGQTTVSEVIPVLRSGGEAAFVRFEAAMTKKPVSGNVAAFVTEREINAEVAKKAILEKVILERFDKVAYIIGGEYRELISTHEEILVIPGGTEGRYEEIYLNYILPAMAQGFDRRKNPLRFSVIAGALEEKDAYRYLGLFTVNGETRSKEFFFYLVDKASGFYLMLIADRGGAERTEDEGTDNPSVSSADSSLYTREPSSGQTSEPEETTETGDGRTDNPSVSSADSLACGLGHGSALSAAGTHSLPNRRSATPCTGEALREEPSSGQTSAPAEEMHEAYRVLLVDDNEINREIGELLMSAEGFEISTAVNGEEAAKAIENAEPSYYAAILMDVNMPVLNGFEATARIRKNADPVRASIPIIALTATASEEELRACMEAGMNDVDTKPLDAARVRNKLLKYIKEREAKENE